MPKKKKLPPRDDPTYQQQYQKIRRPPICTVRGTNRERKLLYSVKKQKGLTWLQIIYRGLGIRRPSKE